MLGDRMNDQAGHIVLGIVCKSQVFEFNGGFLRVVNGSQNPGQFFVGHDAGQSITGHQ